MKYRLLELIVCPKCSSQLRLDVFAEEQKASWIEITEGLLSCQCGEIYPICGSVPRMLLGRLKAELVARYVDFFNQHPEVRETVMKQSEVDGDEFSRIKAEVINRFGYEWTVWGTYDADNFLRLIHPTKPDFFKGKLGLEGGCGAGRHTRQACSYGAEMCAIDLSWGVESAVKNTKDFPLAHIIQADMFRLPFRPRSFDFAYSLGVLQVVADPPAGFSNLTRYLKPNAPIMIWVSSNSRKVLLFCLDVARMITTRLPNWAIRLVSVPAALIDYGLFIGPYKVLSKVPSLERIAEKIPFPRIKGYARYDFRVCYVDWFDRFSHPTVRDYSYEDVKEWYRKNNLHDVTITADGYHAWIGFGRAS